MDETTANIVIEFLEVAVHYILFTSNIYPEEIFENRKKYNAPVKYSIHPSVNNYITSCLKAVRELMLQNSLHKVVLTFFNEDKVELQKFVFDIGFDQNSEENNEDPYLIKLEQNLRSYCLKLSNLRASFKSLPENSSFAILMYTDESTALNVTTNPDMEHFPLIEREVNQPSSVSSILPINSITMNGVMIQMYTEC